MSKIKILFVLTILLSFLLDSPTYVFASCTGMFQWDGCTSSTGSDSCSPSSGACPSGDQIHWSVFSYSTGPECPGQYVYVIKDYCCTIDSAPCSGGGCFTGETPIKTPEGEKEIKDLNIGESVISVDPLTGEELQSKVENIYELEREGYYEVSIELPNGEKETLKVTGEHPLYVKQEESNSILSKLYTVFESIKQKVQSII